MGFPAKEATPVFCPNLPAMLINCSFLRRDAAAACEVNADCICRLLPFRQRGRLVTTAKLKRAGSDKQHADCRKQRQRLECPYVGHQWNICTLED